MDERTIVVTFCTVEERERFRQLCKELGHNEHALAKRLLTNFIGYCEEQRPEHLRKKGSVQ